MQHYSKVLDRTIDEATMVLKKLEVTNNLPVYLFFRVHIYL